MRPELIIPSAKSTFNRLSSGEILHQRELHDLGVHYVGLITHPENEGVAFERIILGDPILDTQRTVFNQSVEEDIIHLVPDPKYISGDIGFIDFIQIAGRYGSRELQKKYGKGIHITYAGIEVGQRGSMANKKLFEGLKLIAQRRGVTYISALVHIHRFSKVFPIFKRLGFREGTILNDGRVKISYEIRNS